MIKVTYLDHSGFAVETPDVLMVFDYYRDPAHKVKKTLEHRPDLPVVFFVTHRHHDHFSHEIFELGQSHKRQYIISNDVKDKDIHFDMPIGWMSHGDKIEDLLGGLTVRAFGTTGRGCSFVVTTADGKNIFHAGELGESPSHNDDSPRDIHAYREKFEVAVGRIAEAQPTFDLAFMAVEPVDNPDFAQAAVYFLEKADVAVFIPYHTDDPKDKACDFASYPFTKDVSTRMVCLAKPGESAEI